MKFDLLNYSTSVIFDIIDKNHDNVIDFSEFLAIATIKNGLDLDTKLELGFGLYVFVVYIRRLSISCLI